MARIAFHTSVARLEASEHALARLQQANARVPELEAEIESLRSAERYAKLQAQINPAGTAFSERLANAAREYASLQAVERELTDLRIYRVGDEGSEMSSWGDIMPAIHVFYVGKDADGNLVVLETYSVET